MTTLRSIFILASILIFALVLAVFGVVLCKRGYPAKYADRGCPHCGELDGCGVQEGQPYFWLNFYESEPIKWRESNGFPKVAICKTCFKVVGEIVIVGPFTNKIAGYVTEIVVGQEARSLNPVLSPTELSHVRAIDAQRLDLP